jgi:hypothetical protein
MNIIEKQAERFCKFKLRSGIQYQEFIDLVESEIIRYSQISHKLQFIETVMFEAKKKYDEHLPDCTSIENCQTNFFYESIIFFLNENRIELSKQLSKEEFNEVDILRYKTGIDEILSKLNTLQLGQQLIYDDFIEQFDEMKSYFYLNKKSWHQLLAGKLLEMVGSGIISETLSKEIVEIIENSSY